jgi:hypothetical protein
MVRAGPTCLAVVWGVITSAACAHRPPPAAPAPPAVPRPVPPATPALPAAPPAITLAPQAGSAGTPVTVVGRGFPPEAAVSVHVGPPQSEASEQAYGQGIADAAGAVTVTFPMLPLALPPAGSPRTVVVLAATPGFRQKATAEFAYAPGAPPRPIAPAASPSPPLHPLGRRVSPGAERAIRAAVLKYLEGLRLMQGVTVEVQALMGEHGRALAKPPAGRGDPAYVFVKRQGRSWVVVAGPSVRFEDEELTTLGIPPGLWPTPPRG